MNVVGDGGAIVGMTMRKMVAFLGRPCALRIVRAGPKLGGPLSRSKPPVRRRRRRRPGADLCPCVRCVKGRPALVPPCPVVSRHVRPRPDHFACMSPRGSH